MRPERWQAIEELYHSASDLPDARRNCFLQEACREDKSLLYEVESLIRHGSTPQSVLDTPAMAIMAKAIAADESRSSAPFLEGTIVSHYRILEPIGRGGMGVVYKAEDLKLRRLVALKLLPQFLAGDPQALHRFEREAQAASSLNHPNICTVYEIDEWDGLHFISIELLEGETLKERMARGPLEVPEILGTVIEICAALEAAHSAGIIHRDIKPSNIVLMGHGAAKLLDFGVAKRIGAELGSQTSSLSAPTTVNFDDGLTGIGSAIGTVAYMSPEQATGQHVDTRSDLFSLGSVLYEMTTGKLPFPGKDLRHLIRAIQGAPPTAVEQLNPRAPSMLAKIINKAMQQNRSQRYQRALDMQADLQCLQTRLKRRATRRRQLVVTVAVVLLLTVAVPSSLHIRHVHEFIFGKSSSSIQDVRPSSRSIVLPPEGTTFNLIGDSGGSVALSANGTKLAFVAVDAKGTARIWVRPLASLTAERLNGTEGATFPFWSPNGRSIAFFADGRLKRINLDGGPAVTLCDAPFGRGGSWNREGTLIFAPASHTGIYKVSDSGGTPTPVTSLDTSIHTTHRWPKFLPDGRHFIYLAASHFQGASHNGVYVSSIDGEEQKLVIATDADAVYASGYLFFMRNDELMAQPFDLTGRQLQGEPRTTVEKVLYDSSIWKSVFDVSERDIMAYELGSSVSGTQLRWFDRSGRQLSVVGETGFQFEPRFSRDGHKLAEVISRVGYEYGKCWVYDLVRGVRTQITLGPYATSSPIWSPDGTRVLFAGKRQHYGIYEVGSGGAGRDRLILDTGTDIWPLDLSPDSRFLLYGQGENVGRVKGQLWIHSLDRSGSPFRLLEGDSVEADGRFSPDGRWVAYSSNESGRAEVYVVPFRVSSSFSKRTGMKEKWKISVHGGEQPNWRRDGRELFYLAADNTLMVVPIMSRGAKFEAGAAHALFHANPTPSTHYQSCYDVSPDGSRFIINTAAAERTAPITLVENWFSDFKK